MARRTLPHPPSDRYGPRPDPQGGEVAPPRPAGSPDPEVEPLAIVPGWRGPVLAVVATIVTAALITFLTGVLGTTIGTFFTAGVGGWIIGTLLVAFPTSPRWRRRLAVGL